ncbi:hypothetical protein PSTG_07157 [Puccinia striiformis f. sp. tritici PST-78]|uniref:Uncharacterized protein n=1 Tax=Puccinia striiformis f. sp. tritici PST-78 TaxID=1165861 RepID=A0A0L0VKY4_9BASI|nr:hypothetical protein PSTG_07157 [Puccinia striiformis f. sp. tritici PST-78]
MRSVAVPPQLNKYDFWEIKITFTPTSTVPPSGGSLQWEFHHPYFRADTMFEVDNVKQKKLTSSTTDTSKINETCTTKVVERTEDILNCLMTHQIQTSSALNKLVEESANLCIELDQAYIQLNRQQIRIDLLLNQSISPKEDSSKDKTTHSNNKSQVMSESNTYYLNNSTSSSTLVAKTKE